MFKIIHSFPLTRLFPSRSVLLCIPTSNTQAQFAHQEYGNTHLLTLPCSLIVCISQPAYLGPTHSISLCCLLAFHPHHRDLYDAPRLSAAATLCGLLDPEGEGSTISEMWGTTKRDTFVTNSELKKLNSKFCHKSSMIPWAPIWTCSALMCNTNT